MTPQIVGNPHEALGRQRKAYDLADLFTANGCGPEEARAATTAEWDALARQTGRSRGPSEDTINLVIEILTKRENLASAVEEGSQVPPNPSSTPADSVAKLFRHDGHDSSLVPAIEQQMYGRPEGAGV